MRTIREEQLQKEVEEHEENYVQMLKHCNRLITERDELREERDELREERDELLKERDELRKECDELRNKLLEIEEISYNYRFDRNHSPCIR